jgi:hypothetical protein
VRSHRAQIRAPGGYIDFGADGSAEAREPGVVGSFGDTFEKNRRQVPLASVGEHHQNDAVLRRPLRNIERTGQRGTSRDTDEDAFLLCEMQRGVARDQIFDRNELVTDLLCSAHRE